MSAGWKFFLPKILSKYRHFSLLLFAKLCRTVTELRYDFVQFSGWVKHSTETIENYNGSEDNEGVTDPQPGELSCVHVVEVSASPRNSDKKLVGVVACRRFAARSSREKNFRPASLDEASKTNATVYPVDRLERGSGRSEQEGVSFKLEIASSAAMMGRKLGAKLNARREEECKTERGKEGERIAGVKQGNETSNNILIFVHESKIISAGTAVSWQAPIVLLILLCLPICLE